MNDPVPPTAVPPADPVAPHTGQSSPLPSPPAPPKPPVPAPAVPPAPVPVPAKPALVIGKPKLTAKEKAKLKAAALELKAHLAEVDPEHPRTGVAGILPPWLALLLKLFGPGFLALVEGELGVPPTPAK